MAPIKSDRLLFTFRSDTKNSVSRKTVKDLATLLGLTTETQVVHYALSKLANEVLLAYEADEGDLKKSEIEAIRKVIPQNKKLIKSRLI